MSRKSKALVRAERLRVQTLLMLLVVGLEPAGTQVKHGTLAWKPVLVRKVELDTPRVGGHMEVEAVPAIPKVIRKKKRERKRKGRGKRGSGALGRTLTRRNAIRLRAAPPPSTRPLSEGLPRRGAIHNRSRRRGSMNPVAERTPPPCTCARYNDPEYTGRRRACQKGSRCLLLQRFPQDPQVPWEGSPRCNACRR